MDKQYISVRELARRAGVRTHTVYDWVWDEIVPAQKLKGRWQIPVNEAERYLKKRDLSRRSSNKYQEGNHG